MYLTAKQHDKLQIAVFGFEIPYRTYIAETLLKVFSKKDDFSSAIQKKTITISSNSDYNAISSELGKIKYQPDYTYDILVQAINSKKKRVVETEVNVPNVSAIIALTIVFRELFASLIDSFKDEATYLSQALRYKYVRNKLGHRGCKTLEISDMDITLDFMSNVCLFISNYDENAFWEKTYGDIMKEISVLQTSTVETPLKIHNIQEMPFSDGKIVCRDREIEEIKEFVYGRPGALRKPSSYVLFGYGGVGKTALALEAIKQIVQDLQDGNTINSYKPDFILFYTAKSEALDFSKASGKIQKISRKSTFTSAEELKNKIFMDLGIESFVGYNNAGLIVIDNLESLSQEDRISVQEFITFNSPVQIQYIVTSRNEEEYECRKKLAGFENDDNGQSFIKSYIKENDFELNFSPEDCQTLLQISKGNTLVLVLCLRRLSMNLVSMQGLITDMSTPISVSKLKKELENIPANGFSIISEYMFKNSFQEIQDICRNNTSTMAKIMKIFAVYPESSIDSYTISILSQLYYNQIEPLLELLCRYLIIEKNNDSYTLNQFAAKYIIQLFLPDNEAYERIENEIAVSTKKIISELEKLDNDMKTSTSLQNIIQDWCIISDGDRIAAAKAYKLYGIVKRDCERGRFHIQASIDEAIKSIELLESNTMHPYVKFQKARIFQMIEDTKLLNKNFDDIITQAYNETIWTIKNNPIYSMIKNTKSYASVLWLFGIHLYSYDDVDKFSTTARYFEEAKIAFEQIEDKSEQYYQCVCWLGNTYERLYAINRVENKQYLKKARQMYHELNSNRASYSKKVANRANELYEKLQKYGQF